MWKLEREKTERWKWERVRIEMGDLEEKREWMYWAGNVWLIIRKEEKRREERNGVQEITGDNNVADSEHERARNRNDWA